MKTDFCKWISCLCIVILLSGVCTFAESTGSECVSLSLPEDNTTVSTTLAFQLLDFASLYTKTMTEEYLQAAGFTVLGQYNYDKAFTDPAHTSACTLASQTIHFKGEDRELLLIIVRGTYGYEWQSNFDFAPSMSDDTLYAENFARAAMDLYYSMKPVIDSVRNPVILVNGYSRGAAVANLLGVLLDEDRGETDIYCYTFATPRTVRGEALQREYKNIFNFINPADIVTHLPLEAWGFARAGQDILLPADAETVAAVENGMGILASFAGGIHDYYTVHHALDKAGEDENGITAYGLMSMMVTSLSTMQIENGFLSSDQFSSISPESDAAAVLSLMGTLGSEKGMEILMRHMPDTYRMLITQIADQ